MSILEFQTDQWHKALHTMHLTNCIVVGELSTNYCRAQS